METEAYKHYSRVLWIFLPNEIKIDPYNFELYRFKVGAFFLRHTVVKIIGDTADYTVYTNLSFVKKNCYNYQSEYISIVMILLNWNIHV